MWLAQAVRLLLQSESNSASETPPFSHSLLGYAWGWSYRNRKFFMKILHDFLFLSFKDSSDTSTWSTQRMLMQQGMVVQFGVNENSLGFTTRSRCCWLKCPSTGSTNGFSVFVRWVGENTIVSTCLLMRHCRHTTGFQMFMSHLPLLPWILISGFVSLENNIFLFCKTENPEKLPKNLLPNMLPPIAPIAAFTRRSCEKTWSTHWLARHTSKSKQKLR